MKSLFLAICLFSLSAQSQDIFRIEVGKDFHQYSNVDLQRRVWELERAVMQIQQRVFNLEVSKTAPIVVAPAVAQETWVCTVTAFTKTYTGTGTTKALATLQTTQSCTAENSAMFCKDVKCEK